jgi:hypothetical protein
MFKQIFQSLAAIFIAVFCLAGCSNNAFSPTAISEPSNGSSMAKVGIYGALDVGVGGGSNNIIWAISKDAAVGGYKVYKFLGGTTWKYLKGEGVRIAVDNTGHPWVVNSNDQLYCGASTDASGNLVWSGPWPIGVKDVACGANGSVWIISNEPASGGGGYLVYKLNKYGAFEQPDVPGAGIRIAVDPAGYPWIVNSDYTLFQKYPISFGAWIQYSKQARDVGIGADGSVWIVSNQSNGSGGYQIFKFNSNNSTWTDMKGQGINISCDASGNGWVVNALADVYQYSFGTWIKR